MKIFSKYIRSYSYARATQLYEYIATEYLLDTSPPAEVIPQNSFPCSFQ